MRIIITAPKGKMGRLIVKMASEHEELEIVGVIGKKGGEYIGKDAGLAAGIGYEIGVPVTDDLNQIIDKCDAVVDFSTPELSMEALTAAIKYKKALVCGTTGFDQEQFGRFQTAALDIPILYAANTSLMINLMYELIAQTARSLGARADIEIIDMHDAKKKDAPSGTAKEMGETLRHALTQVAGVGSDLVDVKFHSVRAGDIPSSHTVIFGCMGERLEITHHSYNWECYARGACDAVLYLRDKDPGLYKMHDVIQG